MNNNFQINNDGVKYADISKLIDVFSDTQFDGIEKAASEILDNSIDANSNKIYIFFETDFDFSKGKEVISRISFLDNGDGLTPGELQHIIGFGTGTKNSGNKIGKFGIGLNQASLFVCKSFNVYSWREANNVYVEKFDTEYIKANNIEKAPVPERVDYPNVVKKFKQFDFVKNHGTLIVWEKLKPERMTKVTTLKNKMEKEFGRIYRNYITNSGLLIYLISNQYDALVPISPIDPMFLLPDNKFRGDPLGSSQCFIDEGEPLFEPFVNDSFNESKIISVPYLDNNILKIGNVTIKAAIIKSKFYYEAAKKDGIQNPGDTAIGKQVKEFQKGITIVRNNREIDFGYFNFYDSTNQPNDRWFKIEIDFSDELDKIFNVSNNKQHVEIKKVNPSNFADMNETDVDYPLWLLLNKDITNLIAAMRNKNKERAKGSKSQVILNPAVDDEEDGTIIIDDPNLDIDINVVNNNNTDNNSEENVIKDSKIIKDLDELYLEGKKIRLELFDFGDNNVYDFNYDFNSNYFTIRLHRDIFENKKELQILMALLCQKAYIESLSGGSDFKNIMKDFCDFIKTRGE